MTEEGHKNVYPVDPALNAGALPDPFALSDGSRVQSREAWSARAAAWRELILDVEYGGMPPPPAAVATETLAHSAVRRWPDTPRLWTYRVTCRGGARDFSFCVRMLFPSGPGPFPAIVNGDGCWSYISDDVAQRVVGSGFALVTFNRTEMAEDLGYEGVPDPTQRKGGLYDVYPGRTFGALAAWAWGYHRCVDLLYTLPFIDKTRIAVTGHSRGSKTVLIAAATDDRITLVNENAGGTGGGAIYRYLGHGGESLNIVRVFPSWFGPKLPAYLGREGDMPFDQHCLLAAIAPRPLLLTYALDDRWSNPEGMVQGAWATGEVYRFLGAPENLAFRLRPGAHAHSAEDWGVFLDFLGWKWNGRRPTAPYNTHPYTHLHPAWDWKTPS